MIGSSVGPYQILEKLGSGGMGEVFLCHDARLQRKVALKRLTSGEPGTEDEASILREARAAARLTHPHIASVYDVLEHEGRAFIVMEYVEGESLRARILRGALSAEETIAIGRQLASALAAAHAQGVIHRDLKPSNVQVMADGTIKVLDFGVAKVLPRIDTMTDVPTTRRSAPGNRSDSPGTPVYMAPEQLIGGRVDARSDIYSLGVVLFEMMTGRRPYLETDSIALAVAMSTSPAPPPDAIDPRVPRRLSSVIVKALQREPFNRYQSVQELGAALEELREPTTRDVVGAGGRVAPARSAKKLTIAAASLLTVAVIAALPFLMSRFRGSSAARAPAPVLAILPVDNPTDDPQAEHFGVAVASLLAANFRSIDKLRVLPRESTAGFGSRRRDLNALKRELGADYVLDLAITQGAPAPQMLGRLSRTDPPTVEWQETIAGGPIHLHRAVVDAVAATLRRGGRATRLSDEDSARLHRLPTNNDAAMMAYVEAKTLLDRTDVPANIVRAVDRLRQAVEADGNFALGYAALGSALLTQYERTRDQTLVDRATAAVSSALRLDAEMSAAQYASGYLQYVIGRRDAAVVSLQRAIALDPDSDDAHRLLGWRLYVSQSRMDDAVTELQIAVRIRPDSFENFYRFGTVLYLAGRYREAVDAYRRATELQPRRADAYTNLGAAYHMLGDVNQAIGNYEHAVGLGAGDAQAYGNLAVSYYFVGRYEDALRTCVEAVQRDPNRASLQGDLGDYYLKLGRVREARGAYARAIDLARRRLDVNPRDAGAVMIIALAEAHRGEAAAADRHVAEALTLAPDDRDVLLRSAKAYIVLKNRDAALERLRMAVERGYPPQLARDDPELAMLKSSPAFENAIIAGLRARARAGALP